MIGVGARAGKINHLTMPSAMPVEKIKADSTWGGFSKLHRNRFVNWNGNTRQGTRQSIFEFHSSASDHIPIAQFFDTVFENVEESSFGYFFDPKPNWANVKDCGDFPCTAPWNVLLSFKGSKFTGARPSTTYSDF
jgi:hypothetical protein